MGRPPPGTSPKDSGERFNFGHTVRHVFLCPGPDCVEPVAGQAAWDYLKKRIKELKLDAVPHTVYRTKCQCLRICTGGPILVVYPEGIWYRSATPEVIERIVQEHLIGGRVLEEFAFNRQPLSGLLPDGGPFPQIPR